MNTGKKYNTKQKDCILQCIRNSQSYITIQEIMYRLEQSEIKVGLTTIYRNLSKLEAEKRITGVYIEGNSGICYRYLPDEQTNIFFNMKCEKCGQLININCPELLHLYKHVSEEHDIKIDAGKTIFYGICDKCQKINN